jgi:diguanylate cyclase (GGDEF)-like protein
LGAAATSALPPDVLAAQWRLLEAAFRAPSAAGLVQWLPACAGLLAFAASRQAWCMAWALAVLAAAILVRRQAAAFEMRAIGASPAVWASRRANALWAQAAILGAGGGLAQAAGGPTVGLLAAVPLCFVAGANAAHAVLAGAARGQLWLLLAPLAAGGLFAPQPAGLAVALMAAMTLAGGLKLAASTAATAGLAPDARAAHIDSGGEPLAAHDFQRLLGRCQITGLPNQHCFAEMLAQESIRAGRAGTKLSLLLLQWDEFERLAASAPQAVVNARLADLARCLGGELRRSADVIANLGGGRFALLLPFTDALGASTVAHNLQVAVRGPGPKEAGEPQAPCEAVSIGAATYCGKGTLPADQLMRFAEEALSAARRTGGDRVNRYDPTAATLRPPPYTGPRTTEKPLALTRQAP